MKKHIFPDFARSYWTDSVDRPTLPAYETPKSKTEVGIVGAGLTGITAAYILSKAGFKVCLLDAATVLNGTSGHTTAKITAQHGLIYHELQQHFGTEQAQQYYKANQEAKDFIESTVKKEQINCQFQEEPAFLIANDKKELEKLQLEAEAYESLGITSKWVDHPDFPFPAIAALCMDNQAMFHPVQYGLDLLEACLNNGVEVFENTRATHIEYHEHPAIVTDAGNRLFCNHIIQASHYPFYDGEAYYPIRMYADRSYLMAAKVRHPLPEGMFLHPKNPARSYRRAEINGEEHLLIGGENHKTGQSDVDMFEHIKTLAADADHYFGLEAIPYYWSAQDYVTLDKLPYVGPVSEAHPQIHVATGFRKWGMTNSANAAKLLSDLIMEKENPIATMLSPARSVKADPGYRNVISYNADVAKHLVKGKFGSVKQQISDLNKNEACVTMHNGKRIGVYKDQDENTHAVDTTCTHLGCEVAWNNAEKSWDCPCHGSRYDFKGEVLNGPAKKALSPIDL